MDPKDAGNSADWEEDDDPELDATTAHASAPEGPTALQDLLLDLIPALSRLSVLLAEADEDEWAVAAPRLEAFRDLIDGLPKGPKPKRRVGFKAPKARKGRAK